MAQRMIEVLLPAELRPQLLEAVDEAGHAPPLSVATLGDGRLEVRLLAKAERTGPLVDSLEKHFSHVDGFALLILSVEAALPPPTPSEDEQGNEGDAGEPEAGSTGISRQELYANLQSMARLDRTYLATVVLSTVVAAVGMLRDSVAVLVGAMVIAPLLGPNVALALSTTLADKPLTRQALTTSAAGIGLAFVLSAGLGLVLRVDPSIDAIASRTQVQLSDIALALAAGSAAVLALTRGLSSALVGVMVAVALLPPTVVFGLMVGAGRLLVALDALLLVLVNVICVNLAGVVTFLVQGVQPLHWWEARTARRSQRIAIAIWLTLLIVLALLIALSRSWV